MTIARITRFRKLSPTSPGWLLPSQFQIVAAEQFLSYLSGLLPPEYIDYQIIGEFVLVSNEAKALYAEKDHLVAGKTMVTTPDDLYFLLLFNSLENWQERHDFVHSTEVFSRFLISRDKVAEKLQVKIDVYEPVEIDLLQLSASMITELTNSLDSN